MALPTSLLMINYILKIANEKNVVFKRKMDKKQDLLICNKYIKKTDKKEQNLDNFLKRIKLKIFNLKKIDKG